jgi:hypothetical protein
MTQESKRARPVTAVLAGVVAVGSAVATGWFVHLAAGQSGGMPTGTFLEVLTCVGAVIVLPAVLHIGADTAIWHARPDMPQRRRNVIAATLFSLALTAIVPRNPEAGPSRKVASRAG